MKNKTLITVFAVLAAAVLVLMLAGIIVSEIGGGEGIFYKFAEIDTIWLISAIAVIAVCILALLLLKGEGRSKKWSIKELVTGSLCLALAFVLSYVRLYKLPQGGSITAASMLPIFIFAYMYGTGKGLVIGIAYGFLQYIQNPGDVIHWAQFFIDYIFAFGALAAAGLFKKNILPGIILGGIGRLFFVVLSGVVFFAEYAPAGQSPFIYSLLYNASYMIPEIIICTVVAMIPAMRKNIERIRNENAE